MKRILTLLTILAFAGSVMAATNATTVSNRINSGLNTLNRKEQALNQKIDNAQAKRAAQKAEAEKKQQEQKNAVEAKKKQLEAQKEANKKAVENQKKQIKAQNDANKKAIENEKNFWTGLYK